MGPLDALRRTEQQIQEAAKRGLHNIEARMRRMHFHDSSHASEQESASAAAGRTGIISVNGQDVERMHCTGGRKLAR